MTEQNEGTGAPASSVNAGAGGASSAPPQGQAAAGTAPAQDWRSSLAPDLRSDQTLAKYQGVDALAKAHIELQRTIGGRVKVPGENDAPEVVAQFRKALGVPEAPDGYQLTRPDGFPADRWDAAGEAEFRKIAHAHGIPPKAAQEIMSAYAARQAATYKAIEDARAATVENLRRDWGDKFDAQQALADQAIEAHARKAGFTDDDFGRLAAAGLGEKFIRMMATLGTAAAPVTGPGANVGSGGLSPDGIRKRLSEIASHPKFFDGRFRNDPERKELVAEQSRLFEQLTSLQQGAA
jgi:hypothetical protein